MTIENPILVSKLRKNMREFFFKCTTGSLKEIFGINLEIGQEYKIINNGLHADFTNCGASDNMIGTIFTATYTTPANWGEGLLQFGEEPDEIADRCINSALIKIKLEAKDRTPVFNPADKTQERIIILYSTYLMYLQAELDNDGEAEWKDSNDLIISYWGSRKKDFVQKKTFFGCISTVHYSGEGEE